MVEEDVYIREAHPEEAEKLSDLVCTARESWISPEDWAEYLQKGERAVTQEFIEINPTYLIEDEVDEKILGFYALEQRGEDWVLSYLYVLPSYKGGGLGEMLFLHACNLAEGLGAQTLYILSHSDAEGFFCHMGAEISDSPPWPLEHSESLLSVLQMHL